MLLSPLMVVITCVSDSWLLGGQPLKRVRNGTFPLPVGVSWDCSVAFMDFCGWIPFSGNF